MPSPRKKLSWVVLHTLVVLFTFISLLTGLRIAAVSRPELLTFSALLPQGYLHGIHLASAIGIIAIVIVFLFLLPSEKKVAKKKQGFHYRVTQIGYGVVLVLLLSGIGLYFGLPISTQDVHYYSALALLVYFFLHAVCMFIQYGWGVFTRILVFSKACFIDAKVLSPGLVVAAGLAMLPPRYTDSTLHVNHIAIQETIEIDGLADEKQWQKARQLTVHTHGGANFINGATDVTIRALHNDVEAFFHISWEDATESLVHLPLIKRENDWQVQEEGFYHFDEQRYYEDKFAIMLADNCELGGSGTAQLGPKPLKNKPANWHGKGYHYAHDGKVRDIWHWKAVRTNDMYLADDNFFGKPDIVRDGKRRYSAGYKPDGKESGAYVMNWQWYSPKGVLPKRIPADKAALLPFQSEQRVDADWVVPWYSYSLYDKKLDHYAPGTVMPSVLYNSNRFEGDRADVRARAQWKDGRWSLELVRPLNTNSPYDVAMKNGVCLWVSAFDHSQIAHTRHTRPIHLHFEKTL